MSHTYTQELENLILTVLLPVYANYNVRMGIKDKYEGVNPSLVAMIKKKKQLPALLRAKEI